ERGAVLPGLEHAEDLPRGHHRGQRHDPAAERLAEDVHIWHHPVVLARERGAGTAKTGLDLVGDHQRAGGGAQLPDLGQVPGPRGGGRTPPASPWIGWISTPTTRSSMASASAAGSP